MAATKRNGKPVTMYVETYDEAIEYDLAQGEVGSLIHYANGGVPLVENRKHYVLALGAFMRRTRDPALEPVGKICETDFIPKGLESFWSGGSVKDQTCAVVVFEQPIA